MCTQHSAITCVRVCVLEIMYAIVIITIIVIIVVTSNPSDFATDVSHTTLNRLVPGRHDRRVDASLRRHRYGHTYASESVPIPKN